MPFDSCRTPSCYWVVVLAFADRPFLLHIYLQLQDMRVIFGSLEHRHVKNCRRMSSICSGIIDLVLSFSICRQPSILMSCLVSVVLQISECCIGADEASDIEDEFLDSCACFAHPVIKYAKYNFGSCEDSANKCLQTLIKPPLVPLVRWSGLWWKLLSSGWIPAL